LQCLEDLVGFDALILAVAHKEYRSLSKKQLQQMLHRHGLIIDVKGILNPKDFLDTGLTVWRL
jgi:UDP-N-acetyl-D-galactosamine dehydrogenase